jgi:hypothetical protein
MQKSILCSLFLVLSMGLFAQKGVLKGNIKDAASGETLISANILVKEGKGAVSDMNGNYSIDLE